MDQRLFFPATERNRVPIGDLLAEILPSQGTVLEVASGSGEHAVTFQRRFPQLVWQASDPDPTHRASIDAWIEHEGLSDVMPQSWNLDVAQRPWSISDASGANLVAVVCINLLHISPTHCTEALLEESARLLPSEGLLIIYGPFQQDGRHNSASNAAFDASLQARDPNWGVRDLSWIEELLQPLPLQLIRRQSMPANNDTLVLRNS